MNRTIALMFLTAAYATGVALLPGAAVAPEAWVGLYGVCVLVSWLLWQGPAGRAPARVWLEWVVYAPLLAALFFGADGALDALNGPLRAKAGVAESLGGLDIWFVFCPGVVAVALGGAVHSLLVSWRSRSLSVDRASAGRHRIRMKRPSP